MENLVPGLKSSGDFVKDAFFHLPCFPFMPRKILYDGKFVVSALFVSNIKYTDGTVLTSEDKEDLQELLEDLRIESEARGLNINKKKTKVRVFRKSKTIPTCNFKINDEGLKQVHQFDYLGSILKSDSRSDQEIKCSIAVGKKFTGKEEYWNK